MARRHPSAVFDGLLICSASFLTAAPVALHVAASSSHVFPNSMVAEASPRFSPFLSMSKGLHGADDIAFREEKPERTKRLTQSVPLTMT